MVHDRPTLAPTSLLRPKKLPKKKEAEAPKNSPSHMFDEAMKVLGLRHDYQLAKVLRRDPSFICAIRSGRSPLPAAVLISLNEETGLSIKGLKALAGLPPAKPCPPREKPE